MRELVHIQGGQCGTLLPLNHPQLLQPPAASGAVSAARSSRRRAHLLSSFIPPVRSLRELSLAPLRSALPLRLHRCCHTNPPRDRPLAHLPHSLASAYHVMI